MVTLLPKEENELSVLDVVVFIATVITLFILNPNTPKDFDGMLSTGLCTAYWALRGALYYQFITKETP